MKKTVLILMAFMISAFCEAKWRVYVDERQELSAIVWRLAGCEEYSGRIIPGYATEIEQSFGKFKNHPVMEFIREMRDAPDSVYVVSYFSVPMSAGLLCLKDGGLSLNEKVNLPEYIDKTDNRWTEDNMRKYVLLLDDFYRKSGFHEFFTSHKDLYDDCIRSMEKIIEKYIRPKWFEDFYGKPFPEETSVCVSPANGINNYGMSCSDPFISPDALDILIGVSTYPTAKTLAGISGIIIHEVSHSFSNPVFAEYDTELDAAGENIFPQLPRMLTAAGYGAPNLIAGEFLNELFSMIYCRDVLKENLNRSIWNCYRMGFIWAEQGVRLMDSFYSNRDMYPVIDDFMPQLSAFMTRVGDQIVEIKNDYNRRPFVESIFPEPGLEVEAGLKEVVIRFSEPMETGVIAINELEGVNPIQVSVKEMRKLGINPRKSIYWKDSRTLIYMIGVPLESGKEYGFVLKEEYAFNVHRNMQVDGDIVVRFKVR